MTTSSLGSLVRVENIRDVWPSEDGNFTPWLAQEDNITILGEAIGLQLEVVGKEQPVGPFRADILCKDTTSGHFVLIENQLERTDHGHLGQLMTYAAGLDAVTIVWIASRFTDEHRAALDWLNRITNETVNFFGLEIELWRIGESPIAPKLNVVSKPNDWQKTVTSAASSGGTLTEFEQLHLDFWTQFRQYMEDRKSPVRINKPSKDSWTAVAVGRSYFAVMVWNGMRDNRSGIQLAISGPQAKMHFYLLRDQYRSEIEAKLGTLDWRELPNSKESQVGVIKPTTPSDRTTWPELNEWFGDQIERWVSVLGPIVKKLDASQYVPPPMVKGEGQITITSGLGPLDNGSEPDAG